ncbi:MAG: UbiX family flavin prenyltransferase [Deltaproteobacteria bacterium]|nr:UbiX family flavin prenyltransferase [Deltaproteobacteria bacterium]
MKIIVAITGATGTVYGVRLLSALKAAKAESHLIVSRPAEKVMAMETEYSLDGVRELATRWYEPDDIAAPIASGQTYWQAMVVAPCSMRTLSAVAASRADTLISRAADITLKERRRLILMPRETPLHLGHLRQMAAVTEMGAIVMPPLPTFYDKPKSIDDLIDNTVGRVLDLLEVQHDLTRPWQAV